MSMYSNGTRLKLGSFHFDGRPLPFVSRITAITWGRNYSMQSYLSFRYAIKAKGLVPQIWLFF